MLVYEPICRSDSQNDNIKNSDMVLLLIITKYVTITTYVEKHAFWRNWEARPTVSTTKSNLTQSKNSFFSGPL